MQEIDLNNPEEENNLKREINNDKYSHKIQAPIYEPSETQPKINECYNNNKTIELIQHIQKTDLPEEMKDFLITASYRFTSFNYELIADYYANAKPEEQALFEDLALIVIDFNKAIQNGFVQINKEFQERLTELERAEYE